MGSRVYRVSGCRLCRVGVEVWAHPTGILHSVPWEGETELYGQVHGSSMHGHVDPRGDDEEEEDEEGEEEEDVFELEGKPGR